MCQVTGVFFRCGKTYLWPKLKGVGHPNPPTVARAVTVGSPTARQQGEVAQMNAMRGTGAAWATMVAALNARRIKSRAGRWYANSVRRILTPRLRRPTVVSNIRHYSKRLRRKATGGTTTRYIAVEQESGSRFLVNIYEVRPTKLNDGDSLGYSYHAVSREWFSKVEGAIRVAEIAFQTSLNSGFHEVVANT
jgi:hypothetical protein